ncbi:MAG: MMPL family transporter [Chloroflexi bacterium]|nr:MMPL family transporter [Chloroflexota bacterium]
MFKRIGRFSIRNRVWIALAWIAVAAILTVFAPSLRDVARLSDEASLPPGVDSVKAKQLLEKNFPGFKAGGNGTIVLFNPSGISPSDTAYAKSIRDWLRSDEAPSSVTSVDSIFDGSQSSLFLVSPDKTVMLINVAFSGTSFDESTVQAVKAIRQHMPAPPQSIEVHVSGEAGMTSDMLDAVSRGIDRTTQVTIILVIVLLLIIYRSPIAALVPLLTISCAYLVSRGVLGYAAQWGLPAWSQIDAYLVVIVFGVGTDYCLFIISRLREELSSRQERGNAHLTTMEKIGVVITASAATVIVGFMGLMAGRLEMFRTMGPFLAIAVFITLIAALTLTPALASLFGRRLFWPMQDKGTSGRVGVFGWGRVAKLVTARPAVSALVVTAILLIPYAALPSFHRTFNVITQLPDSFDSIAGFHILEKHYDVGEMTPLNVAVAAPQGKTMMDKDSLVVLASMSQAASSVAGVRSVRSPTQMQGGAQPLLVRNQLASLSANLDKMIQSLGQPASGPSQDIGSSVGLVKGYLDELAAAYPKTTTNAAYAESMTAFGQLAAMLTSSSQQPSPDALKVLLASLSAGLSGLAGYFQSVPDAYLMPQSLIQHDPAAQGLRTFFFSQDGTVSRFSIILDQEPYSEDAFRVTRDLRSVLTSKLQGSTLSPGQVAVGGATAEFADIQEVSDVDFIRVFVVVFAGIFIVLAILLRSLVAPLYLLLTVLLSYGTTLGISGFVFQRLLGHQGVFYIVPTYLLVILVALGEDYNIFLMSRVREESTGKTTRDGVRSASAATGAIITACGMILAGTFAAMTTAPIQTLIQVGAAIAIGVLVDTFIVRVFLVPSIAAMLGRWNWWPSRPAGNHRPETGKQGQP